MYAQLVETDKERVQSGAEMSAEERAFQEHLDRDFMRELGGSDDCRKGVAAFMDKRSPRFRSS